MQSQLELLRNKTKRFDYKWVIVALCFLMIFTGLGFVSSNSGLYLKAITEALSIPRSAYSLVSTFRYIVLSIINVFFGTMVARFGTKKLICVGFASLILSVILSSVATNVYVFYIAGCLLGVGFTFTGTTMVGCVVNKWCKENKGTIMGAVLAANGLGGAVAAQIVTPIIYEEGNAFGYRNAYLLVAVILSVVALLILVFFKEQPKNYDNNQPVVSKKKARGEGWVGIEYSKGVKTTFFFGTAISIFLTGFTLNGIAQISTPHMQDVGIDTGYVATVLTLHSIALTAFKFLTGYIYDRFGLRASMTMCLTASLLSCGSLVLMTNSPSGHALALVYGIISSLALPLDTVMLPIYANDLFGQKSYDKFLGIFVSVISVGYAIASPTMNLCYDLFGSYRPVLIASVVIMAIVTVIMQFALTAAHRTRAKIEQNLLEQETANV